jgi:hypothetical protein
LLSAKNRGKGLATGRGASEVAPRKEPRIHSIAGLQKERGFTGRFEIAGAVYSFEYTPARAEVVSGKLNLLGELAIVDPQRKRQVRKNVRLALQSTQGGLGNAPTPKMDLPASAEVAAAHRNQASTPGAGDRPLPVTESTGALSFVGVMYLRFEPLVGPQLGVPADLSQLQLNARLYPANGLEETLQYLYSHIIDSLYRKSPDTGAAMAFVKDLNRVLES